MIDNLTRYLLVCSDAVLWMWDGVISILGAGFATVDSWFGPVLAVLFATVNPTVTAIGDLVYSGLSPLPPWAGITIIAALTGLVMLLNFRYTSNQEAITRAKDDIKAHLLAMKLFKEDLRTVVLSQVRLLWAICRLQRYVLTPVVVALFPMSLLLAQMGLRYQWRPAPPGDAVVVNIAVDSEQVDANAIRLVAQDGVDVEAGPVPGGGVVAWRLSGQTPGRYVLVFDVGGERVTKELVIGDGLQRVSALRPGSSWLDRLLHPVERPMDEASGVKAIEIVYPNVDSYICGADWWVAYFFVVSMATALIFKPVFKVKF